MRAPAITAPELSFTVPVRRPVSICAFKQPGKSRMMTRKRAAVVADCAFMYFLSSAYSLDREMLLNHDRSMKVRIRNIYRRIESPVNGDGTEWGGRNGNEGLGTAGIRAPRALTAVRVCERTSFLDCVRSAALRPKRPRMLEHPPGLPGHCRPHRWITAIGRNPLQRCFDNRQNQLLTLPL